MPGSTSTSGNRKIQRVDDDRLEGRRRRARRACTAAARGRPISVSVAVGSRGRSRRAVHGSIVSGTYRPPSARALEAAPMRKRDSRRPRRWPRGRYEAHVDRTRAPCGGDRRHVGLRLAANVRRAPRPSWPPRRASALCRRRRTARRATDPIPTGCTRARRRRPPPRLISAGPARAAPGAARRSCPRATARSARNRRGAGRRRTRRGSPTAGSASASGTVSPSSARACAVSISRSGCTTTAVRPAGTGSRTMSGGLARRTSTKPPQMRRRDVVGVRRAGAEPLAFERAGDQASRSATRAPNSASTATTAAAALAALPPRPLDSGSPLRMVKRDAAPLAERASAAPAPRRRPYSRRLARQAAAVADDVVDAHAVPASGRAVTSSPGRVEREAEDVEAARDIRHGRRARRRSTEVMQL